MFNHKHVLLHKRKNSEQPVTAGNSAAVQVIQEQMKTWLVFQHSGQKTGVSGPLNEVWRNEIPKRQFQTALLQPITVKIDRAVWSVGPCSKNVKYKRKSDKTVHFIYVDDRLWPTDSHHFWRIWWYHRRTVGLPMY